MMGGENPEPTRIKKHNRASIIEEKRQKKNQISTNIGVMSGGINTIPNYMLVTS